MKRKISPAVLLLCMVFMMPAGCSVKENRGDCPCCIMFDFSGVDTDVIDSVYLGVTSADGFLFSDNVLQESFADDYCVRVPRGEVNVNVNSGTEGLYVDGHGLAIPYGSQCPPVYMYSIRLDADREFCECSPFPAKNYCGIILHLVCEEEPDLPFSLRITGNVCGYDVIGRPLDGDFSYIPELAPDGVCSARIPRQKDNSLSLEIVEDGMVLRRFALGNIMAESGYDWSAESLGDMELTVNYSKTDVTFIVDDWEKEFVFDITI